MRLIKITFISYLLGKRSRRDDLDCAQEIIVSGKARLKDKHASIEVKRGPRTQLFLPLDPIRALLAIPKFVLWGVTPSLLTETVLHGIEVAIWHIKEVIYVLKHLDISIQVYHLAILHKLHSKIINTK